MLAACATAGAQNSLTVSAVGCGGRQSASNCVIASAVGFGGFSQASTTTLKSGYAAQLYDVTALALSASSTNVYEGSLVTISATAGLDDGSYLAVPATNATWPAPSFPLSPFITPGMYVGASVYANEIGAVTGAYFGVEGSIGLAVSDNDPDNYSTAPYNFAYDGIPDSWQATNFGLGSSGAAPTADTDGDAYSAIEEFFFNTDPTNGSSAPSNRFAPQIVIVSNQPYFAAALVHREGPQPMEFTMQLGASVADSAWTGTALLVSQVSAGAGMVTDVWRDVTTATNGSSRFMRVFLEPAQD